MLYAILEQRFPKKSQANQGDWEISFRPTGVLIEVGSGEEALLEYRRVRSVCLNPIAATPAEGA